MSAIDAEYFVVTVKIKEEKGWSKSKNEPIYKNITEKYLVHCGDPRTAAKIVEHDMKDFTEEWRIYSVSESKVTKVIENHDL